MQIHIYLFFTDKKTIDYSMWYNISTYTVVNLGQERMAREVLEKSRSLRVQVSDSFFKREVRTLCKFRTFCIIRFLYSLRDQSTLPLSEGGIPSDTVTQMRRLYCYFLSLVSIKTKLSKMTEPGQRDDTIFTFHLGFMDYQAVSWRWSFLIRLLWLSNLYQAAWLSFWLN